MRVRAAVLEEFGQPLVVQELDLAEPQAGEAQEVGDGVSSLRPGDQVVTLFAPECGECVHCRSERTNRCVAIRDQQGLGYLPDGTTRLSRGGEPMRHFMGTSTFAEHAVMPEIALAKVSPEAPLEGCAPFACGLATGIGAALYTADVQPGSTCVVFGCGLVGFGADYTFEATGNVNVMRQAVEAAREAWGLATMCVVAGKGQTLEIVPRFLITGRRVTGS